MKSEKVNCCFILLCFTHFLSLTCRKIVLKTKFKIGLSKSERSKFSILYNFFNFICIKNNFWMFLKFADIVFDKRHLFHLPLMWLAKRNISQIHRCQMHLMKKILIESQWLAVLELLYVLKTFWFKKNINSLFKKYFMVQRINA